MNTDTELRIVELLDYDPATGAFTWKRAPGHTLRRMIGKRAGRLDKASGYIRIHVAGKTYGANRLAVFFMTGKWPQGEVDHKNGNRSDDRWANLREASHSTNQQNLRKAQKNNKSSGLLGVSKSSSGVYVARIYHDGEQRRIGSFQDAETAHAAYVDEKRKVHAGCTI